MTPEIVAFIGVIGSGKDHRCPGYEHPAEDAHG